jgi:hypothetical protein
MNRKLKKLFTVPTLIAVFLTTTAFGFRPLFHPPTVRISIGLDDNLPVRTETAFGLQTTTFDTLEGTVTVNLPDDLAAGDTISGTVIAEAKKQAAPGDVNKTADQPIGMDELSGYVVELAKQPTTSQTHDKDLTNPCSGPEQNQNDHSIRVCRKWSIPDAVSRIPLVLKNRVGKIVSRTEVPVAPKGNVARVSDDFSTPPVGQAGKPLSVNGPFDGDFANTRVKLANHAAKFLASSPRKVVVESPRDLNGLAEIEIEYKGNTVAKCNYRSVSVRLAADKLNLIKGEQTTLTVNLAGLIGLLRPVSVQLTNKSPQTVSMGGGETQIINVNPAELNGDTFTTKRTLTGVQAGGFSISAVVDPIRSELVSCTSGTTGTTPTYPRDESSKTKPPYRSTPADDPKTKPADRPKPADDPKLKWQLVNPYGIDAGSGSFHAGRTLDVLVTKDGGVIAASETAGVWLLPPSGSGIPLSRDWENTEVYCLAFGPYGEGHVYAGLRNIGKGTTLVETDTSKPVPLRLIAPWKSIPLPSAVGSIYQIAVVSSRIALACDGGVYWSSIPSAGGTYNWTHAEGLPDGAFFSVAEAKGGGLVAGAWGNSDLTDRNGIFVGSWNSSVLGSPIQLMMHRAKTTGVDSTTLYRVSIDSCVADRKRVYAMSIGGEDRVLNAVLRSDDGGETWSTTKANYASESGVFPKGTLLTTKRMGDNTAGGSIHRLKVSPVNSGTLSVSGLFGYISRDNGDTWYILGDQSWGNLRSLHADVHEVDFNPNDPSGKSLVVASDGGVAISTDLGNNWTDLNETYPSLQLYGTSARGFYGCGTPSLEVYGVGTQDNGNVYTVLTGSLDPWKHLDDGDGGQWHSFRLGGFIRANSTSNNDTIWRGTWNPDKRIVEQRIEIPVRIGGRDVTGTIKGLIAANVNSPAHRNEKGQTMYTVGAIGGRIHGLFANDDGGDIHWEQISDWVAPLDQIVSAVGSATGKKIYLATFGAQGAQMYMVNTETGSVSPMGPLPPALRPTIATGVDPKARVHRFVVLNDESAFGLYTTDRLNSGYLLKTADGGATWETMPAPSTSVTSLELDWTSGSFYLSDTDHVYVSRDQCKTWIRASWGLPQHCEGMDLRFIAQPDGKNYLYMATYGWSMWRLQTNP